MLRCTVFCVLKSVVQVFLVYMCGCLNGVNLCARKNEIASASDYMKLSSQTKLPVPYQCFIPLSREQEVFTHQFVTLNKAGLLSKLNYQFVSPYCKPHPLGASVGLVGMRLNVFLHACVSFVMCVWCSLFRYPVTAISDHQNPAYNCHNQT